jgi:tRNA/rRNA methyltransferase
LETKGFIHEKNRLHITEKIYNLFGRLAMTSEDKDLLLAMFSKGVG